MALVATDSKYYTAIANSINKKRGSTALLTPEEMSLEIDKMNVRKPSDPDPLDSVEYYKATRNKNFPNLPLPSEMTNPEDTIYLLYDANGYMCCPAFNVTCDSCNITIEKYMNKTLVSSSTDALTNGTDKFLWYSEEDADYKDYKYILLILKGSNITKFNFINPKFKEMAYDASSSTELLEFSGKCPNLNTLVIKNNVSQHNLTYFSLGENKITDMHFMFKNACYSLQSVPQLDTSKVTTMYNMFDNCYSLQSIPQLDASKVTDMSSMFYNCSSLRSIPQLDTSNVTYMGQMFYGCSSLQSIPQLNTSNVTNMNNMFYYCDSLQSIPQLDTSKVTFMENMFYSCNSLQSIPQLNTSKVTNMKQMFGYCRSLQSIPQLDTSNVTDMGWMFYSCKSLQSIPQLDTSKATNMNSMFYSCSSLQSIDIQNISQSFSISSSKNMPRAEIVKLLNNLATVETTQTLTLDTILMSRLTEEDKAIATTKNWTLA